MIGVFIFVSFVDESRRDFWPFGDNISFGLQLTPNFLELTCTSHAQNSTLLGGVVSASLVRFSSREIHLAVNAFEYPLPIILILLHQHVTQFGWDRVESATVHYDNAISLRIIVMLERLTFHELWLTGNVHIVSSVTDACSDHLFPLEPIRSCRVDQQLSGFAQPVHGCFVSHFCQLYRYIYLLLSQHCLQFFLASACYAPLQIWGYFERS